MYILTNDLPDRQSLNYNKKWKEGWKLYNHELQRVKNKLRPSTQEFALAEWHYNPQDPRCPHDAWLEEVRIREIAAEETVQKRTLEIVIRLLGAYHDGQIELTYKNVLSYCLDQPRRKKRGEFDYGHGDWLVDEIRFAGTVIHEIEWAGSGNWIIECDDIEYRWIPNDEGKG